MIGPTTRRSSAMLRRVLFLCSGNYYRSRFCEALFNDHAAARALSWHAFSRALRPNPARLNPGPMSLHAIRHLRDRGISPENHLRLPLEVTKFDLESASIVVAVCEREHRVFVDASWPEFAAAIEYWDVPDLDVLPPHRALPRLGQHVDALILRLSKTYSIFDAA